MQTKTWIYGTVFNCEVISAQNSTKMSMLSVAVTMDDGHKEGFTIIDNPDPNLPAIESKGTITFTKGGQTGGYWKFKKA